MNKKYFEHGSKTRLYRIWCGMKARCYYPKSIGYKNYMGKGIVVCDEWKNDYVQFRDWSLANGYNEKMTLDRIDSNGNYEPHNCRWVSYLQQNNNSKNNRRLTLNGETHTIAEWSRITGINSSTIDKRKHAGLSDEKALTTPVIQQSPLTEEQINDIFDKRESGMSVPKISKEYKMASSAIYYLLSGRSYKKYTIPRIKKSKERRQKELEELVEQLKEK